jgi:hypothetical protein
MVEVGGDGAAVRRGVDALLSTDTSGALRSLVARYLGIEGDVAFTGRHFDTFGANPPSRFVGDDLLACAFLDTPIKGAGVETLLVGDPTFDSLLQAVDHKVSIWDIDTARVRESLDRAGELYERLTKVATIGWTRAHKLIARKRPTIHPVYDSVVSRWFFDVDGVRYGLHQLVAAEQSPQLELDEALRPHGVELDTLRLLDIAVWMCGSRSRAVQKPSRMAAST